MTAALAEQKFSTTITIAKVFDPKPGRKSATIKDVDGNLYSIWATKRTELIEGETYEVEYKGDYKDITSHRHIAPNRPARVETPQQPQASSKKMDQQFYRPTSPEDKKSMFRCAQITAFIRAGQLRIDRNEIAHAIGEIDAAYDIAVTELAVD